MDEWHLWARVGLWNHVNLEGLLEDERRQELAELRAALACVVPVIPADEVGVSLLTEPRRALVGDVLFLTKHVKQGHYAKTMRRVESRRRGLEGPSRWSSFAMHLERTDILEDERMRPKHMERPWRAAVEQAQNTLVEAGIVFVGLGEIMVDVDISAGKVTAAAADPEEWRGLNKGELIRAARSERRQPHQLARADERGVSCRLI